MTMLLDLVLSTAVHHDAAEEGRRIMTAMLIVGLIFASIVVVGEFVHWYRHDRPYRRQRGY